MADRDAVTRALAALADGSAPEGPDHRTVVESAVDAVGSVEGAAAFVAADGRRRLRRAVSLADRRDDEEALRAGRRALSALADYRRVAGGEAVAANGDDAGAGRGRPCERGDAGGERADHFRSGRGTVLGDGGKGSRR